MWTTIWFSMSMAFAFWIAPAMVGEQWTGDHTKLFITGYVVELSLSMDNVFVIALIFSFFRVPAEFQVQCRQRGALTSPWQSVLTTDLSAGGISFQSESMLEVPEPLDLRMTLPSFRAPLVLSGVVVRVRSLSSGVSEYAVEFGDVTPEQQQQIDALVQFLRKSV